MKTFKHFVVLVIILCLLSFQQTYAKIWRVNNNSNYNGSSLWGDNFGGTATFPVFKQIADANNSNLVSAGDTIYVEGSTANYEAVTINKKLAIVGPGFFLNENPHVSNDVLQSAVAHISFTTGSEGSQLIGMYVYDVYGVSISVNNILIKRCRIDAAVTVSFNISDISIVQNYFVNATATTASAVAVSAYGFPSNFIFDNNICQRTLLLFYSTTTYTLLECKNNVFDCPSISGSPSIKLNAGSFQNNILKTASATVNINGGTNQNVSYNISASATGQFGTSNHNTVVTNMTTLFVASGTSDGKYKLKNNSPGSNNGSDGTDRGAFGGAAVSNRYTLSGLAPVPVIYDLTTSGVATPTDGLSVTISARTIK
jgi:hypothetical protein